AQFIEQETRALRPFDGDHGSECLAPFPRLDRVDVTLLFHAVLPRAPASDALAAPQRVTGASGRTISPSSIRESRGIDSLTRTLAAFSNAAATSLPAPGLASAAPSSSIRQRDRDPRSWHGAAFSSASFSPPSTG